ncbi:hypothetical protein PP340_gp25 [Arthrobacter phage Adaia]|uniref:Uncharacterized protein n=1 Tax=Arthrobacter phage Adaia TaxID=2419945 RepID=A0A3G2KCR6_9CAUD|nr:hypothetical protein PP340_gp25 [Arthrobacter phage Adaia]AYN56812.1 hypothetical protein PBI_ADAIA_25 [Arthrobacter phage Adaia]
MMRRLINRIQGKVWSAECPRCEWSAGRSDLTKEQADARLMLHKRNTGHYESETARYIFNLEKYLK